MKPIILAQLLPVLVPLLLIVSLPAQADIIGVVNHRADLTGSETLDWGEFGPVFTSVASGSSLATAFGVIVTVSQPEYEMQVRQENAPGSSAGGWSGDFLPGQDLLTNWNSPFAVTISFSTPVFGAGLQIEPGQVQDLPAPFTATVTAFDGPTVLGQFSTTGTRSNGDDDSVPFLGVTSDTADITSLAYSVTVQTNGPYTGDLGMNFLSVEASAVPEPSSVVLNATCLVLLAGCAFLSRKRKARIARPAGMVR
jgi:hypothetical protein